MASLYLIVPVSIVLFGLAAALFMWSVEDGQYDDLEGEGGRILYDEDDDSMAEAEQKRAQASAKSDEEGSR